ncbi:uncharacterized protein LOC132609404 [Lycium barbarum]|uniref:uncharacterized protein LOC132609404 n=1 Tax=Lycium barbarum TaxID=112863 RepID=UPI00293EC258|nr:uncharacterized protein LOC132609404 [Lycium barbarum]
MASSSNAAQVPLIEYYDTTTFQSAKCSKLYDRLLGKSFIEERGIVTKNLEEKMPEFYGRLVTSGWIRFADEPIRANHTLVRELYANAAELDITHRAIVKVRGVDVLCNASRINAYYNLQDGDNSEMAQMYEQMRQQWFVTHLHGGEQPKWLTTMQRTIDSAEFTAEAKTWLDIVTSRVLPSKHDSEVPIERDKLICAVMEGLPVDVGRLIMQEIREVVLERTKSLFFPSLITYLCSTDGVPTRPGDKEKEPGGPIHPLKKRGPGNIQKKRKIDIAASSFGQFTSTASDSAGGASGPPMAIPILPPLQEAARPFQYISTQVHGVDNRIQQLVASLPLGPHGEGTSTAPSGPSGPTLAGVVEDMKHIKEKQGKIERRQKKAREHAKKQSKFLNKMMSILRSVCGAQHEEEENEEDFVLLEPSSSSSEGEQR